MVDVLEVGSNRLLIDLTEIGCVIKEKVNFVFSVINLYNVNRVRTVEAKVICVLVFQFNILQLIRASGNSVILPSQWARKTSRKARIRIGQLPLKGEHWKKRTVTLRGAFHQMSLFSPPKIYESTTSTSLDKENLQFQM